ncbi:hypothetical protein A7M93_20730 [Acinetobacter baumannii]|nr:hypothetical protein A7M93_20730 [Acinetobacter baumannii]
MAQKINVTELKHRLLAKEHHMRIFFNSENYFMINTEIIRSEIYTRVDMRGTNHEIKIGNLLRHERTKDNNNKNH